MIVIKDSHKHLYDSRSYAGIANKNGEIRYFLFNKCKCGDKYAYDYVKEKP